MRAEGCLGQRSKAKEKCAFRLHGSDVYGLGRLHTLTNPYRGGSSDPTYQSGRWRTFTYDSLSRLTSATNPESGLICYGLLSGGSCTPRYDGNGNLLQRTDARGIVTRYAYDALHRITGKSYSDSTPAVAYSYDTASNGVGKLVQVAAAGVASTNYTAFDAMGRVKASAQTLLGQTYWFGYSYNLAGALSSETYPSGRTVTTGYDGVGHQNTLSGVLAGRSTNYLTAASYWPHGAEWMLRYGNNVVPVYGYNSRLQLSQMYATLGNSANAYVLYLGYNWGTTNNNGNLQNSTEGYGSAVPAASLAWLNQSYTYDDLNQLTGVSDSGYSRSMGMMPLETAG